MYHDEVRLVLIDHIVAGQYCTDVRCICVLDKTGEFLCLAHTHQLRGCATLGHQFAVRLLAQTRAGL